ncbi:MAG: VanZ family protein [Burkholderiales bacterium]|nr:VanZ family protein [Burkholderiales bacterium]
MNRSPRALRALLAICLLLIVHGSLYPWRFEASPDWLGELRDMFVRASWWSDFDDVLGNIVLFAPLGTLGLLVLRDEGWATRRAIGVVALSGLLLAFGLQVGQIFVVGRDASITDVLWNSVGLGAGLMLTALGRHVMHTHLARPHAWRLPGVFIVLWLGLQWWPFALSANWDRLAMAVSELPARWATGGFVDVLLSLAVLAHCLRDVGDDERRPVLQAVALMGLCGKLLFSVGSLSLSNLLGLAGGLGLAPLLWRATARQASLALLLAAIAWYVADSLRPFHWRMHPGRFEWRPFVALLYGSMLANLLSLTWNLFWTGAIVALGQQLRAAPLRIGLAVSLGVLLLELAQRYLPGRIADVTNALLPLIWVLALAAISAQPPSASARAQAGTNDGPR